MQLESQTFTSKLTILKSFSIPTASTLKIDSTT